MPLPITAPSAATSTASPASKSPSTRRSPTGSRLEPLSRRTRAAPASTDEPAARRLRVLEPELEAGRLAAAGRRSGCRPPRPRRPPPACPGCRPVADHRRDAGLARHLRRGDLAAHAARAEGRGAVADLQPCQLGEVARPRRSARRPGRCAGRPCRGRRRWSAGPAGGRRAASPPGRRGSRCRRS